MLFKSQRRRMSATGQVPPADDGAAEGTSTDRIRVAEQALAAVQEAEGRLQRGRYGFCDSCNEPIGWDELLQSPEQTSCRSCSQFGELGKGRLSN